MKQTLLDSYGKTSKPDATTPTQWKQTLITVLHSSGDARLPNNYRPITIIPLLYKVFPRLLYNRLEPTLDARQSPDQAGFCHNFSTDNLLLTFTNCQ